MNDIVIRVVDTADEHSSYYVMATMDELSRLGFTGLPFVNDPYNKTDNKELYEEVLSRTPIKECAYNIIFRLC